MLHVASELSCIGEEPYATYDRPPLSKTVQAGCRHAKQPLRRDVARLRQGRVLGRQPAGQNSAGREVHLVGGQGLPFDPVVFRYAKEVNWSNYVYV
jgi:3-phenylpropionate/trans-cinnamate dioxygenase ferredoxin reductase component